LKGINDKYEKIEFSNDGKGLRIFSGLFLRYALILMSFELYDLR